ncbi:MAG: DUF5804 family protein [Methanocorpusculum sp.]|nr:DUF5804 family protein [Methanocorpusculum sp.]
MHIICAAKADVNLHRTLAESETSRHILRFYRPLDLGWGVRIEVSTVSSALSLMSELRWYINRYMSAVLIEDAEHGVYLTRELAAQAYEDRSVQLMPEWPFAYTAAVFAGGGTQWLPAGVDAPAAADVFLVWGTERECP